MRLLVITNMYPSEADPVLGTFVRNITERMNRRNAGGVNDLVAIDRRRYSVWAKMRCYAGFYLRVIKQLLSRRYDLIYIHKASFPIPPVRFARLFRSLPTVVNVHGDDVLTNGRLQAALQRVAAPEVCKAMAVVCPSEYYRGILLEKFPRLDPSKVIVSPSGGIDSRFFEAASLKTQFQESDNEDKQGKLRLGFVSRIDKGKGWDTFLKAISLLRSRGYDVTGFIAGRGDQNDQLRAMISQLGLEQAVEFNGPVPQDRLPALYASFDLFIFPTTRRNESLGLVGVEALAAGTPVIASNMAGPTGYVRNGENGWLFTPGSAEDLARKIEEYISLPAAEKERMSRAATRSALPYEAETVADKLYASLQAVLVSR